MVLTAASLLPVGSASADPAPPAPAPRAADAPEPAGTPDRAQPPKEGEPVARERPREADEGAYDLAETAPADADVRCTDESGPYQRQIERGLGLTVDGEQSAADCRAVRAFQTKQGIEPAIGFTGPVTWASLQLAGARAHPNAAKKCPVRAYRVACVDLDRQLTWVQQGRKVVFGPVSVRSGRTGYDTRTGWYRVYWRDRDHVSSLYNSPMPYSQFFSGGQAFHGVYGSIYTTVGSMGCVNMRLDHARTLWGLLKNEDRVYVWGRRPVV
ncbi:hypothetical protein SZN_12238 [Streptomyces zinciresistens K42]|uniref:L,D-TPase catalytic domain-containing protein n=1 Tax=Streptomyces zinciresistens K42 TaxID=700597 RepID=G2GAC5_9ACTN|nr:hypothetical protein SZN_12238 [Streptomyces zinciresistens K42]